jgi:basic amino acid/polyamine antiporter, APA family
VKLFLKKSIHQLVHEAGDPLDESRGGLKRHLTALHLTMLGVGGVIGAGIFSITGTAAANYAGPAIVYSFIIGGVLCCFAGFCYSEMASMVPVSGSAYSYAYVTLGELIAWIIGWDLVLEYAVGAVTVSVAWSGYFYSLIYKTWGMHLPDLLVQLTKGPFEVVTFPDGRTGNGIWNLPASLVITFVSVVLYRGIRESSKLNNIIVAIKVTIIVAFIVLGWAVIDQANWIANPAVSGLAALVPPEGMYERHGTMVKAFGWPGVLTGAGIVFFAYIGFDAVSTAAQETVDPKRDLPIGILVSLGVCTVLYILMALVMTGVVPYTQLGVPDPVAVGIDRIVELRGWGPATRAIFTTLVKLGALAGLTSVILVLLLGQTRVFYAMARDGLLPWFDSVHTKFHTPHIATAATGVVVAVAGGLMPLEIVGELCSIGTLLAFVLVCIGIPILRKTAPDAPRAFRVPAAWFVAPAGALACIWVMSGLPLDTWMRLIVWLAIGFVIYFTYGIKHSRLRNAK